MIKISSIFNVITKVRIKSYKKNKMKFLFDFKTFTLNTERSKLSNHFFYNFTKRNLYKLQRKKILNS